MEIKSTAQSGSLESSDILVTVKPADKGAGRKIELQSVVLNEYGQSIREDIQKVLDQNRVSDVELTANDRGALPPTIKARVEAALRRASRPEVEK
ncbi:MAG: citrate lyase acyl carrier protein [Candidatus Wallbacteria bacterium]|nr:citrate lyase acyl carrier protein [Candidatus Wallbacteria bacterium]